MELLKDEDKKEIKKDFAEVLRDAEEAFKRSSVNCRKAQKFYEDSDFYCKAFNRFIRELRELEEKGKNSELSLEELKDEIEEIAFTLEALGEDYQDHLNQSPVNLRSFSKMAEEVKNRNPDAFSQRDAEIKRFKEAYFQKKKELGLRTQEDVADITGIDRRQISRLEAKNVLPQYRTIEKIAKAFMCEVEDFL